MPTPHPTACLKLWMIAVDSGDMVIAVDTYRALFRLIESGIEPDWKAVGIGPSGFYGWGLQHVPERKHVANEKLAMMVNDMSKKTGALAESNSRYAIHNDGASKRLQSYPPPAKPRCPKCRMSGFLDFEEHVRRCHPWNTSTLGEIAAIEKSNALLSAPPKPIHKAFTNAAEQYGHCVNELGKVHARLVQAPSAREIQALVEKGKALLALIEAASTGL